MNRYDGMMVRLDSMVRIQGLSDLIQDNMKDIKAFDYMSAQNVCRCF